MALPIKVVPLKNWTFVTIPSKSYAVAFRVIGTPYESIAPLVGEGNEINGRGRTMTVQVFVPVTAPSLALSSRTYVPLVVKLTCVLVAFGFWKVTVPLLLITLHWMLVMMPCGSPSSVTVPDRTSVAPSGQFV